MIGSVQTRLQQRKVMAHKSQEELSVDDEPQAAVGAGVLLTVDQRTHAVATARQRPSASTAAAQARTGNGRLSSDQHAEAEESKGSVEDASTLALTH